MERHTRDHIMQLRLVLSACEDPERLAQIRSGKLRAPDGQRSRSAEQTVESNQESRAG